MKLHIGAFDQILPGWVNTDITPHLYLPRVPGLVTILGAAGLLQGRRLEQHRAGVFRSLAKLDFTRRFPYPDASMDAVYGSHMLASIRQDDAQKCLNECFRVLKPGGVVRMAVVDLDAAVRGYDPADADKFMELIFCLSTSKRAKNRNWWHFPWRTLSKGRL